MKGGRTVPVEEIAQIVPIYKHILSIFEYNPVMSTKSVSVYDQSSQIRMVLYLSIFLCEPMGTREIFLSFSLLVEIDRHLPVFRDLVTGDYKTQDRPFIIMKKISLKYL
jgi:hypothetical protein